MEGTPLWPAGVPFADTATHYSEVIRAAGLSLGVMIDWTGNGTGTAAWDILASNRKQPGHPASTPSHWVSIYTLDSKEARVADPDGGTTLIGGVQLNVAFEWYCVTLTLAGGTLTIGEARALVKQQQIGVTR